MYGSEYLTYGATPCARCGVSHAATSFIRETQQSRFRLMQLIAEMSAQENAAHRIVMHAGAGQKFMIGLLITPAATLVATSGSNLNNGSFVAAAGRKHYQICPARRATVGEHRSIVNRLIPAGQYMSMQAGGASPAGDCAAPRLIERGFELNPAPRNLAGWAMSEVFYQPNTQRRTRDDMYWVHGLSAHSCATCANLVPLLLCPQA